MSKRLTIIPVGKTKAVFGDKVEDAGVLHFRIQCYAAPTLDFYGFYKYYLRDSILKTLRHIYFPGYLIDERQHRPRIDQAEYINALKSALRDFNHEI